MKKDFIWEASGVTYKILNVPYEILDGEEVVDLEDSIVVELIRELMHKNRVSPIVDFDRVANMNLDF